MKDIIEIQEEVVIEQDSKKIILEKGDRIEVLKEAFGEWFEVKKVKYIDLEDLESQVGNKYIDSDDKFDNSIVLNKFTMAFKDGNQIRINYVNHSTKEYYSIVLSKNSLNILNRL
jgi:hypothetical protein